MLTQNISSKGWELYQSAVCLHAHHIVTMNGNTLRNTHAKYLKNKAQTLPLCSSKQWCSHTWIKCVFFDVYILVTPTHMIRRIIRPCEGVLASRSTCSYTVSLLSLTIPLWSHWLNILFEYSLLYLHVVHFQDKWHKYTKEEMFDGLFTIFPSQVAKRKSVGSYKF